MVEDIRIHAMPTKEFFIEMLTKDIQLMPAIIDLVDNCIDGAARSRGDGDLRGLWVKISFNKDQFQISDNCGGIDLGIAKQYAFRFGRPKDAPESEHSMGRFGVGMKRALFKMGKEFQIISTTEKTSFKIALKTDDWAKEEEWDFDFDEPPKYNEEGFTEDKIGTMITVTSLHTSVSEDFKLGAWEIKFIKELSTKHVKSIEKGMSFSVNGIPINRIALRLLSSSDIVPANKFLQHWVNVDDETKSLVNVRIFAGIDESSPDLAGWYVFCNDRMILEADQTGRTNWGDGVGKYHNQYARFRGYIFFDSTDPKVLPWNTTKTSVDEESEIYRAMKIEMRNLMKPVLSFLSELDRDLHRDKEEQAFISAVDKAVPTEILQLGNSNKFVSAVRAEKPPSRKESISYKKPTEQVQKVMKVLKVDSRKKVGEKTFEYFYDRECAD